MDVRASLTSLHVVEKLSSVPWIILEKREKEIVWTGKVREIRNLTDL